MKGLFIAAIITGIIGAAVIVYLADQVSSSIEPQE